jgi:hypothetical protein
MYHPIFKAIQLVTLNMRAAIGRYTKEIMTPFMPNAGLALEYTAGISKSDRALVIIAKGNMKHA